MMLKITFWLAVTTRYLLADKYRILRIELALDVQYFLIEIGKRTRIPAANRQMYGSPGDITLPVAVGP